MVLHSRSVGLLCDFFVATISSWLEDTKNRSQKRKRTCCASACRNKTVGSWKRLPNVRAWKHPRGRDPSWSCWRGRSSTSGKATCSRVQITSSSAAPQGQLDLKIKIGYDG